MEHASQEESTREARQVRVGQRLRAARQRLNLSQEALAELLGANARSVRRWERGEILPQPHYREQLCRLFQIDTSTLFELGKSEEQFGHYPTSNAPDVELSEPGQDVALWHVPFPRNPHFTGRDELLAQLARHLAPGGQDQQTGTRQAALTQPQAIKGLGGIGKTQIAVEYAYRAHEQGRYTHILWINAASEEAIITSFVSLAEPLPDLPEKKQKDQAKLVAAVKRWLEQCQKPWLLIFDNADDLVLAQKYIPTTDNGSILLTTRANAVGALAVSVEVEKMGLIEGTQLLLHRAQRLQASDEERNEAANVVIALDGFPLALDQAGAYIEETGCSVSTYLQLYQDHRQALLARRGAQTAGYPDSVATTWALSFQKIERTNPAAAELLRLCAFLDPDYIPEELLQEGAPHWPPLLQKAVSSPLAFNQMLEALLAFSLVKRLADEQVLSLHRLIQVVQRDVMETEEQRLWAERTILATSLVFPTDVNATTWARCRRFLSQAQVCSTLILEQSFVFAEAASLLFRIARYLRDMALYEQAEPLFRRTLQMSEQIFGPDHPEVARSLDRLARLYSQQAKFEQAEQFAQRALAIREKHLGSNHVEVADSLEGLATIFGEQERPAEAEPLFRRAVQIWEQTEGPDYSQLASALDGWAICLIRQNHFDEAEALLQRALRIREKTLGPEHPDIAASLLNLAGLYQDQGKYEQAEPMNWQALQIWERVHGANHLYLAYPLHNLASLYYQQGKYEQAGQLFQRAISVRERTLGEHHPDIAEALGEYATSQEALGKHQEAVSLSQRALTIYEQSFGLQHPTTIKARTRYRTLLQAATGRGAETERAEMAQPE